MSFAGIQKYNLFLYRYFTVVTSDYNQVLLNIILYQLKIFPAINDRKVAHNHLEKQDG